MILLDTSGLLAALDGSSPEHEACRRVAETHAGSLVLSPFVLAELDYLLTRRVGQAAALELLQDVAAGSYALAPFDQADVAAARAVMGRYLDLVIGLADASLVVLADRHSTGDVLTLDRRHFRTTTWGGGRPFRLLPADG